MLPAALCYWRISSIYIGYPCEPPLSHVIERLSIGADAHRKRIYSRTATGDTRNSKAIKQTKCIDFLLTG